MNASSQHIFFSILRSILLGTPTAIPADTDWLSVLNLSARQKCLHAFSVWLKAHCIITPFDKQLHANMYMTMQRQVRQNYLAIDVINLLALHNIPATLIKGYSLSVLYPDPDTRDFGDVDIYVGEANYLHAVEIVTAAYPNAHWHSSMHGGIHYILVIDENSDRVIELHRVTMEFHDKRANALYQNFTSLQLTTNTSTIDIYGNTISIPDATYNALYVFMHAWHHFEGRGVGFRQLADWALCLQQAHQQSSTQEWKLLTHDIHQILSALHMKTAWQTFGHILINELHLPEEAFPLYTTRYQNRAKRLLRQILRDGHGGRPAAFNIKEIALMRRFPIERPSQYRVLQKAYTCSRLLFNAYQMGKFFPDLAWYELRHSLLLGTKKHT